jgi:thioredoxin 1
VFKGGIMSEQPKIELLDFWAEWCGPCKIMEPIIDELAEAYKNKLAIRKIDVDAAENQSLVMTYNILSVPTYILMKNGEVVDHFVGVHSKESINKKIEQLLA